MPLGIAVGLQAEARLVDGLVEIGGGLPAGAEQAAERLIARGATALLSFGLAGGLDPSLRPGALLIPEAVREGDRRYAVDADLLRALGGSNIALIMAADTVVAEQAAKCALAATGASAVDLESGAVARVALRHGVPFAVLRAVCDPAERSLPPAALVALDAVGAIGGLRIAGSVLSRPWQIPALVRLAFDAATARRTLARAATRLETLVTP